MSASRVWVGRAGAAALVALLAACSRDASAPTAAANAVDAAGAIEAPSVSAAAEIATAASLSGNFFDATAALLAANGGLGRDGGTGIGAPLYGFAAPAAAAIPTGLSVVATVKYYDKAGAEQPRYDKELTAKIVRTETVTGTTSVQKNEESRTTTIDRKGQTTVSGLEGKETTRIVDGSEAGTITTDATTSKGKTHVVVAFTDLTTHLVVPAEPSVGKYPLSGTVSHKRTITATNVKGETRTESVQETVTFDGTSTAKVQVVTDKGTKRCTRDLATHKQTCQ